MKYCAALIESSFRNVDLAISQTCVIPVLGVFFVFGFF